MRLSIKEEWITSNSPYVKFLLMASAIANAEHILDKHAILKLQAHFSKSAYHRDLKRALQENELKMVEGKIFLSGECLKTRTFEEVGQRWDKKEKSGTRNPRGSKADHDVCNSTQKSGTEVGQTLSEQQSEFTVEQLMAVYNECFAESNVAKPGKVTNTRQFLAARYLNKAGMEDFKRVCIYLKSQPFYMGENDRSWTLTFDWMLNPNKFIPLLEKAKAEKPINGRHSRARTDREWIEINMTTSLKASQPDLDEKQVEEIRALLSCD